MVTPVFSGQPLAHQQTPMGAAVSVFITVFLITVIVATGVTFILPETYCGIARIKVDLPAASTDAYGPSELEAVQSEVVLSQVVEKLKLNEVWLRKYFWGKKGFDGKNLKTEQSLQILKGRLSVALVRNTNLIAITAYSDDRREAADLANAVAEAYRDNAVRKKSVEIIDRAIPAVQPCKPNKPLNIALGFVAGIVFGMLFATLAWALTSRRS